MWSDPIVDEVRKHATAWTAQFNGDVQAMFEELRRLEREAGVKSVTLPHRMPEAVRPPIAPLAPTPTVDHPHQAT
jgi:hypothetical protein